MLTRGWPPASDAISVDEFHRFSLTKVEAVRAATAGGLPLTFTAAPVASSFTGFHKVTVQPLLVNSHCTDTVQVGGHRTTDQEARPRLCRSMALQADFQFISGVTVQASQAYCFLAALQLPVCGRPSATPAVCSLHIGHITLPRWPC